LPRPPRVAALSEQTVQSDEGALEGPSDSAREQDAVEHAGDPAARLVLDHEPVDEAVTVRLEATFVVRVGQARLRARVATRRFGSNAVIVSVSSRSRPRNRVTSRAVSPAARQRVPSSRRTKPGQNLDQFAGFVTNAKACSTGTS
jgi:hypothetical protein